MKITVVSYAELNRCPTKSEVIDDVCRLYLSASKELKEDMGSLLNRQLSSLSSGELLNDDCSISFIDTSDSIKRSHLEATVSAFAPDLLVSYNLAGFELSTLADSLLYNLINCRQFHIINKKNVPNQRYLNILRSINLFIFEDC